MVSKILSQLMILSFAFAGLFLVVNNVFADPTLEHSDEGGGTGRCCTVTIICSDGGSVSCTGVDQDQGC